MPFTANIDLACHSLRMHHMHHRHDECFGCSHAYGHRVWKTPFFYLLKVAFNVVDPELIIRGVRGCALIRDIHTVFCNDDIRGSISLVHIVQRLAASKPAIVDALHCMHYNTTCLQSMDQTMNQVAVSMRRHACLLQVTTLWAWTRQLQ